MSRLHYYTRDITQVAKESVEEENRGELDVCVVELREIKIREGGWNWGRVSSVDKFLDNGPDRYIGAPA